MAVTIEAYEDWGAATGSPLRGTNRTLITNANLKTYSDPAQHYFLNDLRRPPVAYGNSMYSATFTRYIYFKLSGTFNKVKNIRIELGQPSGVDFTLMYKLTNTYAQPANGTGSFGELNGVFDGTLTPFTQALTLFPRLSSTGPESATSRPITSTGPVYTEYLVLQSLAHPGAFDAIDNYGCENITLMFEELE